MIHKLSFDELHKLPFEDDPGSLRIIKFYSSQCRMCHALKETYVRIAESHPDVKFYVFNVDIFDGDPEVFPMIQGVPTVCAIDSIRGFVPCPDPRPPHEVMWYTAETIEQFIQKEKQL